MKYVLLICFLAFGFSQEIQEEPNSSSEDTRLFEDERPLKVHIKGNIASLLSDRGAKVQYHPMVLRYQDGAKQSEMHACKLKARGNFRRQKRNCSYPPLWLNFPKKNIPKASIFQGQNKLKIVMPCKGDRYVKREYMVYKLHQLLSPRSFKVRLLELNLEDATSSKSFKPKLAFLIEAEEKLAERLEAELDKMNLYGPKDLETSSFLEMAVFEFLIANTDWSVQYKHNIKIIKREEDNSFIPIAYDFDHAGLVSAPYAQPAEELGLSSVRSRRFRGYCPSEVMPELEKVWKRFLDKKEAVFALYQQSEILDEKDKKFSLKFLEKFFEILENEKKRERLFNYPCDPNGTGNIVIRGLNN
ncbi:MAG: hypothetical protein AAF696_18065 [Bacteroidota bacterium]